MKPRRRSQGSSLAETLIACLLFLLALALISTLFGYAVRMTRAGEGRADQTSTRMTVAGRLRRAMLNSYQSGNSAFYRNGELDSLVICLISSRTGDGRQDWDEESQKPVFHGYEIFYREASDNTLRWCRVDIAESRISQPLEQSQVLAALSLQDLELSKDVTNFQLFSLQDGSVREHWANPLGIRLVLSSKRGTPIVTEIPFKFVSL